MRVRQLRRIRGRPSKWSKVIPPERPLEPTAAVSQQIVENVVKAIREESKDVPQDRISKCIMKENVEVMQSIPQECDERTVKQEVDVPV